LYIIDWEYYSWRYAGYDRAVFEHNLRHKSMEDYLSYVSSCNTRSPDVYCFLLEELLFRILNYKSDVNGSADHIFLIFNMLVHGSPLLSTHEDNPS